MIDAIIAASVIVVGILLFVYSCLWIAAAGDDAAGDR